MSTSVIKQIVSNTDNSQTIKMIVKSNERGPRGPKGDTGLQGPQGIQGPRGFDGAIQYHAGPGIVISEDNMIAATGEAVAAWGGILGNIADQTDLQNEFDTKQDVMSDFVGATGTAAGESGKVPAPAATDNVKFLKGDATWGTPITPDNSVSTAKIVDAAVTTVKINDGAVTTNKIADASVTTVKIDNGAITTAKINDEAITTALINNQAVTAAKIDFSTLGGNYSTSEQDTGYTWIDGKHIYKKTIDIGTLPNNSTVTVAHNITGISNLVKMEGSAYRSSDNGLFPLPYIGGSETLAVTISANSTSIFIGSGSDRSNMTGYVTMYYTKSS